MKYVLRVGALFLVALTDCDDATSVAVVNAYPDVDAGAQQTVVFQAWWFSTLFADPVAPGGTSTIERTVPGSDYAYALLAPNWDPATNAVPATLLPIRTIDKVDATGGTTLSITLSPGTVAGDCRSGATLSQDEADFITQRIFPGSFSNRRYDATTCTTTPVVVDGGDASME